MLTLLTRYLCFLMVWKLVFKTVAIFLPSIISAPYTSPLDVHKKYVYNRIEIIY